MRSPVEQVGKVLVIARQYVIVSSATDQVMDIIFGQIERVPYPDTV